MINLLITFYNIVIQAEIVLDWWQHILDTLLEKEKGLILGKLQIIELLEVDFQMLVQIFTGLRNDDNIENDKRLSQHNYRSRKYFSIEATLLEKILLYDTSKYNGKKTMHVLSNLEAFYNRQIPSIGCIVEESLGVNRSAAKVISKTIEAFNYKVCTSFSASPISYGGKDKQLVGANQVNIVLGAICRDVLKLT